ncbi:flagellar biosynthetic protein FliR [Hoeflea sp. YIM 152468]|uniref:flagellar biosynthetic protein FliR n=1 Tax=Hoeflea sp. YIM 152468 TaxID=3031759 RepID=UPI0023DC2794|nr:flagellar biosynthetic protein FliR [Hoeflea sp. YIM 152468]MDF1610119.1 flagellar biosynthetic protein FliR [Hoeflea sp. YIM 152468]
MIEDPEGTVLALFATFCRIGGCFMVLPGFSSFRVPLQIRLFLAVAVSLALMPLLWDTIYPNVRDGGRVYILLVGSEMLIGVTFGLVARYIVLALQYAGTGMSMAIGFNAAPGGGLIENEAEGHITSLITFAALFILFLTDFHHMIIGSLVRSYSFMPMGTEFDPRLALMTLTDTLAGSFMLVLRLASPFLVYGLIFNLSIGMVNKLAPQIPVYFISIPFILCGGLILLFFGINTFLTLFADGFETLFMGAI